MSWGVATQNGVSVSLASIVSLSAGVTEFSPADLFTGGVQGAWYDPSDYSTLFQDSAGTTPVTAVEQPVGLMLDKSQGLVLGSEVVVTPYTGTVGGSWLIGSSAVTRNGSATSQASVVLNVTPSTSKTYLVQFTVADLSGDTFGYRIGGGTAYQVTANGTYTARITGGGASATMAFIPWGGAAGQVTITNISVKEIAGNHASQATAASRPVLRARYNLLTYSEQFDNAAWTKSETTISANSTTAPDGTTSADTATPSTNNLSHRFYQAVPAFPANAASVYFKANGYSKVALKDWFSGVYASFDLAAVSVLDKSASVTAGISSEGNGWYRCRMTTTQASTTGIQISLLAPSYTSGDPNGSAFAGDGTSGVFVWGAQYTLRSDSSAGTYQRIAAATDYATAGFLPYLAGDGTDDNMVIPATAISGATAMTEMHAAWRPAGFGAGNGAVFGGTGTATTNDHEPFSDGALYYGFASSARQAFGSLGTVTTPYILDATQTGTTLAAYRNGTQLSTTATVSIGIGANPRLFVSNNSTLQYYQGNFFGGLLIKKVLSAAETSAARSWFAAKAGITL